MYAIIDIETTGGQYNEEGITEIAIQKFDGIDVVDTFISLVNPEREIQPFVVNLTGINNKMLRNAPKFYEIAKRVVEITNDCIIVAHNANFDYRILRTEFRRLGYEFERPTLCTVELSKHFFPERTTFSLGKLSRSLGIPISDRHRANGDALATLKLFQILLSKDIEKKIITQAVKVGNQRDLSQKLLDILEEIPNTCGMFYIHDYRGKVLYLNKAKNMKKAVNQLFLNQSKNKRSLRKQMQKVSFEPTGSMLIAELKYLEEIKLHKPKFNQIRSSSTANGQFSNQHMILIDKGRTANEKSVILIEDGTYKGFGFTDLNYHVNNLEVLRNIISPAQNISTASATNTINTYLKKNKVEKIIRL